MGIERNTGEWLRGSGPESDVVMSSRIRLARNVRGFPFRAKLDEARHAELSDHLADAIQRARLDESLVYSNLDDYAAVDRDLLMERHLISREHASGEGRRGVAITRSEAVSVMTMEEDHLRLQVLRSGFDLDACWEGIDRLDDAIEELVGYAFDPDLGYLTACPTNVGTGIRASVMLHLPGLRLAKHRDRMVTSVTKINLAVRGLYGEGTDPSGDFYQVSNQVTLGRTEREILEELQHFVPRIIEYERKVRERLFEEDRQRLEDRVAEACGTLRTAATVSSEEAMALLSLVRLGVNMGVINDLGIAAVNSIFINCQPAHIMKHAGTRLDAEERDVARARYIQQAMGRN